MGRHSSEHCSPLRFVNATTLCSCNWCVRWPHPLLRTLSISLCCISKLIVRFHSWDIVILFQKMFHVYLNKLYSIQINIVIIFECVDLYEICIRKTWPCNEYTLKPHFYIAKLGYAGVYLLCLVENKDCMLSEAVLTCTNDL